MHSCSQLRTCLADRWSARLATLSISFVALLQSGRGITGEVAIPGNRHRAYCHLIDSHRHRSIHTRVVHGGPTYRKISNPLNHLKSA